MTSRFRRRDLLLVALLLGTISGCRGGPPADQAAGRPAGDPEPGHGEVMPVHALLRLTSPAFAGGDTIPRRYTCDGEDRSPPLRWEPVPPGTAAWVLVCDDPDAPRGTWQHWLLVNLPAGATGLAENEGAAAATLPEGAVLGVNSWGRRAYGGPCPPPGKPHRYFFRLYALSEPVPVGEGVLDREALDAALRGRVLAQAVLMGTYGR